VKRASRQHGPVVEEAPPLDALANEAAAFKHPLGRRVAESHDRLDAVDPVHEQPVDESPDCARRHAAAARAGEEPVADLDRVTSGVELAERRAPEDLAGLAVEDCVRDELPGRAPLGQLVIEHGVQLLFAEGRKAGFAADYRIGKGRRELRHVVVSRCAQDEVAGGELVGEGRHERRPIGWSSWTHRRELSRRSLLRKHARRFTCARPSILSILLSMPVGREEL
jgi:hypothetical protein